MQGKGAYVFPGISCPKPPIIIIIANKVGKVKDAVKSHVVDIDPGEATTLAPKPVGHRVDPPTPKSACSCTSTVPNNLALITTFLMASANAGFHSHVTTVPADSEDAGPLHGEQSSPRTSIQSSSHRLTLNKVRLLQSWTSPSSTTSRQLNPYFPPSLFSPLALRPGP